MTRIRALVLYAQSVETKTFSYQTGWPRELTRHRRFDATPVNLLAPRERPRLWLARARSFDAVVLLHSVFSNTRYLRGATLRRVTAIDRPKALFVGNEYKLMPAKIELAERLRVSLLVSQLYAPEAHDLYRQRLGCAVIGIPNTGLDPTLFRPRTPHPERPIDLGYRAQRNPLYLGHDERLELVDAVGGAASRRGLAVDVSLDLRDRFTEPEWAAYLDRCKGQLGSEAGGDYFELTDATRDAAIEYLAGRPDATAADLFERFYRDRPNPVSGRAMSGRIVEAAGAKTVQLLLEGEYGGYFQPNVHYIPLRKDLSNVDEALDKLLDEPTAMRLANNAYEVAHTELTYERLIDRFADALQQLL